MNQFTNETQIIQTMKKTLYLLILPLLCSCYKDKSSTRYEPIGTITIENIERSYDKITLVDTLKIMPVITSTDPLDNVAAFEYLWTYYNTAKTLVIDTIQNTKDLSWIIALNTGSYVLTLRVSNPANGYTVYETTSLRVETDFSFGFYLLKETAEGNTELDFHNPDKEVYVPNLLTARLGAPITGMPTSLGIVPTYPYINQENGQSETAKVLVPMGGKDLKVMRVNDMSLIYDYDKFFYSDTAPDEKPVRIFLRTATAGAIIKFITDKALYTITSTGQGGKAGFPVHAPEGSSFTGAVMSNITSGNEMTLIFDEANGEMIYYAAASRVIPPTTVEPSPYEMNYHVRHMGYNGWSLFEEKTNPLIKWIYRVQNNPLGVGSAPLVSEHLVNAVTAPNFNSAEFYSTYKTAAAEIPAIFYGCKGDKIYMYNVQGETETVLSPEGMGSGETVTMITDRMGIPTSLDSSTRVLIIATYKEGNYKVYVYANPVEYQPYGPPVLVLEGTGKVVDVQHTGGSSAYTPVY